MDPETQIQKLLEEISLLDKLIDGLKDLKKRKRYSDCLEDTVNMIDNLKHKKKELKKMIAELTEEVIESAEVCECF